MSSIFCFLLLALSAFEAKQYYVSSSIRGSSGANTPANPMSFENAIKTLESNSIVSFLRGDVFSAFTTTDKNHILPKDIYNITFNSYSLPNTPNNDRNPIITQAVNVPPSLISRASSTVSNVYVADLSSIVLNDPNQQGIWGVWINGVRYMLARYPNLLNPTVLNGMDAEEYIFARLNNAIQENTGVLELIDSTLLYPNETLKNLNTNYWAGATIRIRQNNWGYQRTKIASVNGNQSFNLVDNVALRFENGFFLEDKFDELDAPGEYYYDKATKQLFYVECPVSLCPRSGDVLEQGLWVLPHGNHFGDTYDGTLTNYLDVDVLSTAGEIPGKRTSTALNFPANASDIVIKDLDFTKSFVGINMNAYDFSVSNCEFRDLLSTGIYVRAKSNGIIKDSVFKDIDFFGVASRGDGVVVDNVKMSRIAMPAGYTFQGSGVFSVKVETSKAKNPFIVKNSQFKTMGYSGIEIAERDIAEYNVVEDWALTLADVGAIYTWESDNIIIRHNVIKGRNFGNIASNNWPGHGFGASIYVDEGCKNVILENNTINTVTDPCIRLNNVFSSQILGNRCAFGSMSITARSNNNLITRNDFSYDNSTGLVSTRFYYRQQKTNDQAIRDNVWTINNCIESGMKKLRTFGVDILNQNGNIVVCNPNPPSPTTSSSTTSSSSTRSSTTSSSSTRSSTTSSSSTRSVAPTGAPAVARGLNWKLRVGDK